MTETIGWAWAPQIKLGMPRSPPQDEHLSGHPETLCEFVPMVAH